MLKCKRGEKALGKENNKLVKSNVHTGHRNRVREKLLSNSSFDSMLDHELLEFILFQSIPQGDTNPIAHNLINKFGSLNNVLEASAFELMQVEGIGKVTALHLASYLAVTKRYLLRNLEPKQSFEEIEELAEFIQALCMGNKYETAYVLFLDKSKKLIRYEKVSEGGIASTTIYTDKIVASAVLHKAYYIVLGHNHPSGNVRPSTADVVNTKQLLEALINVRKFLLDSIIVSNVEWYSMAKTGVLVKNHIVDPFANNTDLRITD